MFVDVGSRDESEGQAGIAHALEHMLFKGTARHDVHAISRMLDRLGGNANAFTSRERTCLHMHVLHEAWPKALDILTEMLLQSEVPEAEWQREREVIFAEMGMVEDSPEDWVLDRHMQALFPDHALGRPTLGTQETLSSMTRQSLLEFLRQHYRPPRLLICAAGRLEHEALVERVTAMRWPTTGSALPRHPVPLANGIQLLPRQVEQAQIVLSYAGIPATSGERPAAWLANQVLGGGMSSRLFSEIREKRGLAYHIASHLSMLSDTGVWTLTCATEPGRVRACIEVIRETVDAVVVDGITEEELALAQSLLEVQLRMGMDSVEGNMLRLGGRFDESPVRSQAYWLEQLRRVDVDTLHAWLRKRLSAAPMLSVCGPQEEVARLRTLLS
jgi:predicted Zn-dependent peptidase